MKKIILIIGIVLLESCTNCDHLTKVYLQDQCTIIVEYIPSYHDSPYFDYRGKDINTHRYCSCKSEQSYRWWNIYKKHIDIGDTIVKKKGEMIFSIHKKDTVLVFKYVCGELQKNLN